MYLKSFNDIENKIQQDEWTLTKPIFGKEGQVSVIGWLDRHKGVKMYVVECKVCKEDVELFGDGLFVSPKNSLLKLGSVPCGCSINPYWTEEQYKVLCRRNSENLGNTFIGWKGDFNGCAKTNIIQECKQHGVWDTASITTALRGQGCPICKANRLGEFSKKSDEVMIASFMELGQFPIGTKFTRSDRKDKRGNSPYWRVECPICGEEGESLAGNLRKGDRCCGCSRSRQQEAYINIVEDGEFGIYLKFGISSNSGRRLKQINQTSSLIVKPLYMYVFSSVKQCKQAEILCKKSVITCIVDKELMPDGYTETTYLYNLSKIIQIYEQNGGMLKNIFE